MKTTRQRIATLLINTKDHVTTKRDIRMRLRHLLDFEEVYADMIAENILQEFGTGRKGSVRQVRLLDPAGALKETE